MVMCFAPTCKHYSERDQCTFFTLPKNPGEHARWLKLIRRKDRSPSKHSRICSCHFLNGDRKNGPTLFDYNIGKRFATLDVPVTKARKSQNSTETVSTEGAYIDPQPQPFALAEPQPGPSGISDLQPGTSNVSDPQPGPSGVSASQPEPSKVKTDAGSQPQFTAMLEAENYFLKQEVDALTKKLGNLAVTLSCDSIKNNDHLINVYTGLPTKDIFLTLYSLFSNLNISYFRGWQVIRVPKIDQFLLTLMKLKLNAHNDDLAFRFQVSRETVANIFKTWLFALHEILFLQLMTDMPSRNKNKMCMPSSFSSFTNCRVIIDCTELSTIHPKNMERQRVTYSSYKHRNTLKGLIGVAPNGVVTFASSLYPGSVSDKKISAHCGITEKLVPGDLVLADKGFLIADILPQGVALNIPPFLTTGQFTPEQVIMTRTIARARIHVERAIRRIKLYAILSMVPAPLIPHASVVFQVCAALTNLQFPLIKEVEKLYDY